MHTAGPDRRWFRAFTAVLSWSGTRVTCENLLLPFLVYRHMHGVFSHRCWVFFCFLHTSFPCWSYLTRLALMSAGKIPLKLLSGNACPECIEF